MQINTAVGAATRSAPGDPADRARQSKQAILVWSVFFVLLVLWNGTIPFMLGVDLRAWTQSICKSVVFAFLFYAVLFLAVPLVLVKGWQTVRQPGFMLPLVAAIAAITLSPVAHGTVALALVALAYLHWRYDLSGYGIRSSGWKGDLAAIAIIAALGLVPALMRSSHSFALDAAFAAALDRWFANPASSFENLFYFGFVTERLSYRVGTRWAPPLIGLMYTAHEMSNPEYWYGGSNFALILVGVTIWASIYLWRRSVVAIWLGDGLYRFVGRLL